MSLQLSFAWKATYIEHVMHGSLGFTTITPHSGFALRVIDPGWYLLHEITLFQFIIITTHNNNDKGLLAKVSVHKINSSYTKQV